MRSIDEEIARHLQEAAASGELAKASGYGKPQLEDPAWNETPAALRMPFRILKAAGVVPPEIALFHERAALKLELKACTDEAERIRLGQRLSELEQSIALRLESLRRYASE
jgi:hypothetical protein